MAFEDLQDSINSLPAKKRWTFTLENGRGETYSNLVPTLYAHSIYERGSVLAGRPQRVFVCNWKDWGDARIQLSNVKHNGKRLKYDDMGNGGSTHIPVSQMVSHLPDDTDY